MVKSSKTGCVALIGAGMTLAGIAGAAEAPKSLNEMWKIIQQQQAQIQKQQQEIEKLKSEASPAVAAKSKVKEPATGASSEAPTEVKEVSRKTDILAEEVSKLRTSLAIPEEPKYKSQYGLGPAASKVYGVTRGLSIGGYGEAFYSHFFDDPNREDRFDLARVVTYIGYKFNDQFVFNSEIEYEHGTTGEGAEEKGEVSVEFATIDYFYDPRLNMRAGLVLVPMGFINEIHEPLFFHGNNRPAVERAIIPSTWREMGAGLFGEALPGLQYRIYAINSLNAAEFESEGIREARQSGSSAKANDLAVTARFDYTPAVLPGLMLGGSMFMGNAGQGQEFGGVKADAFTQLYELHAQLRYQGLEFRALGAWGYIDDAAVLSAAKGETIGASNYGYYMEVAYDVLPWLLPQSDQYLAPFFRYEHYDTTAGVANSEFEREIYQAGLSYKPITNVVLKADYRNINGLTGSNVGDEINLGLGFIF